MTVDTIIGIIENGRVRLPAGVVIPENKMVYVIVPTESRIEKATFGIRLANPDEAEHFSMKVTWGDEE